MTDTTIDVTTLGATELAAHMACGAFRAEQVMACFLDRIAALNPTHNAIVSLRPREILMAEAAAADAVASRGTSLGPLHGLPIAIKDLAATAGLRTTLGSPLFADAVPEADAIQVARIRAAGAIIIGKTNVPDFGLGSHTVNPVFGPTRNAFDPGRSAGGSSGGAAVALALRMVPIADGSDFGGSLRNPAAWNGVFGFRPSQGRVPAATLPDAFLSQLSTEGPMARNVADLALLLSVQAGYDARAPLSLDGEGSRYEAWLGPVPAGPVAWLGDLGGHLPFEAYILDRCRAALDVMQGLGCPIEPVVPPFDYEALWRAFVVLRQFSVGGRLIGFYRDRAQRALLNPQAQWECEGFLRLSAADLHTAAATRTAWYTCLLGVFDRFRFLALPSAQVWPFPIAWDWPRRIAGHTLDSYHRWMEVVAPITLSGCPVVNVPAGLGGPGGRLPMGLQLVGPPRDDLSVLRIAHAYEQASPWIREHLRALDGSVARPPAPVP